MAVGVILDAEQNILITRRASDAHQGGLWEFPGGKVEPGESLHMALSRELKEELDIDVGRSSELLRVTHDYGDKKVLLDVHVIWEHCGEAVGLESQPLNWVSATALSDYEFPAANVPIVEAVQKLLL